MSTNLTNQKIKDTFDQLLHIDGGPEAAVKHVYSGTGVQTALQVGTDRIGVGAIVIGGNFITTSAPGEDIVLLPAGDGALFLSNVVFTDVSEARAALLLGNLSVQNSDNVNITGGTISGVVFTGSFSGLTLVESATLATGAAAAGVNLSGNTLGADGTDTDIDVNITPKGTGEVNVTNIDILSGKVPFNTITGRAYGIFYDLSNQTFVADTATIVEFDTTGLTVGVTVASNTRITFAAAGTYEISSRLQFANLDNADYVVDVWFRLDGVDIPYSATEISVPRSTDGGKANHSITGIMQVTAGQYLEVVVAVEDADTSLHYHAPLTTPYARPAVPSAILVANRIA